MKILVTGGAGFIGSHVVDEYVRAGHYVVVLDDFSTGKQKNINNKAAVYRGSIQDRRFVNSVVDGLRPDVINHHAAQVSVVDSVKDPNRDAQANICGTINMLEAAREYNVRRFIYASSGGTVYGDAEQIPTPESSPVRPVCPYGLSKATAEGYAWLYRLLHGIEVVVLRYGNVYGARQSANGEAGVCAIFCKRMLENKTVTLYEGGLHIRDYVDVRDVARANLDALNSDCGTFNISRGIGVTTLTVFEEISEATGYSLKPVVKPGRPGEAQCIILNPWNAWVHLRWAATVSFTDGIRDMVRQVKRELES